MPDPTTSTKEEGNKIVFSAFFVTTDITKRNKTLCYF
jgi:hypothetical protein